MTPAVRHILGVDIGGGGMKAAIVDVSQGALIADRVRIPTPRPATPGATSAVVAQLREATDYGAGRIGCAFPGVVASDGTIRTAANLDSSWIGVNAHETFGTEINPVTVLNDADAAGIAELRLGAGRDIAGVVVMVTIGTGLGTAVFSDGRLVPNTELGHIEIDGIDAETRAAGRVVKDFGLPVDAWARRFERYLTVLEDLLWPDLFILGGGISRRFDDWAPLITRVRTPMTPAAFRNEAGIIGAALHAAES